MLKFVRETCKKAYNWCIVHPSFVYWSCMNIWMFVVFVIARIVFTR